ncbi:MAG: hypothetical protein Q9227_007917 [Pyrenula ochraceoflavens]
MSKRLEGKVAVVTGAASGFGLAITQRFVSEGCKVVAADLNESALQQQFSSHSDITPLVANVTSSEDWSTVTKTAIDRYGGLDILINNAGTSYKNKPTLEVTEAEFDKVFATNLKSIYWSIATVVPEMIRLGKGGAVINVASIGAVRPRPGLVWYNASKGAVHNATKGLAAEYGPHQIRVNSICPLLSGTGLFEVFTGVPNTQENRDKFLSNVPLGRLTDPLDVANAALYLASDEGKFVTEANLVVFTLKGVNLEVDGGRAV